MIYTTFQGKNIFQQCYDDNLGQDGSKRADTYLNFADENYTIVQPFLTEVQCNEYKRLHKKSKEKRFADRIKSILALDRGYSFEEIAVLLMIDDTSIRRWYEQYHSGKFIHAFLGGDSLPDCNGAGDVVRGVENS